MTIDATKVLTDKPFLNVASYKFVDLSDSLIRSLRYPYRDFCRGLGIRGTIILSMEGINVVLSGLEKDVRAAIAKLREQPEFEDLYFKESWSESIAFSRMLAKIKSEVIPTGIPDLRPPIKSAPYVDPQDLKQWLDEGRDFILLDTRNDYEVSVGTFHNAKDLNIDTFRAFPDALKSLDEDIRKRPIVTFCTGGIRCEKAAPLMIENGFEEVYQLRGGILEYFEQVGDAHFDGECFVFDQRVAVNGDLAETDTVQCYMCQRPLSIEEQASPLYELGKQCPYCASNEQA